MEYVQEITLDLNADSVPVVVSAKQDDELTRKLKIYLMSDGKEYQPEPDAMVLVRARRPDGSCFVDGAIATIDSNIVEVTLTQEMLYAPGRALVDIVLYNGGQYLSTASFILKIQPSPSEVMNMAVPTDGNDYPVFLTLMSALGSIEPVVSAAVAEAVAASNSAKYQANNFSLTAGDPMEPGADPSVSGTAPSYIVRLPSIKPMATIAIHETGIAASATVKVENFEGTAPTGLDPNLIKVFDFDITLPSGRNVQIDNTLRQPGQAADAAAVGSALDKKYTMPSSGIPLSSLESGYIIPIANGGTGSSDVAGALVNLGAQPQIQSAKISLFPNAWSDESAIINSNYQVATYNQTINVANSTAATPTFNITSTSQFIATPYTLFGWNQARECGLYPPQVYASSSDHITFAADAKPSGVINIQIYYW